MSDDDLDRLFKQQLGNSHAAALRAVFDAGWYEALGNLNPVGQGDPSLSVAPPISEAAIATV